MPPLRLQALQSHLHPADLGLPHHAPAGVPALRKENDYVGEGRGVIRNISCKCDRLKVFALVKKPHLLADFSLDI